MVSVSDGRERKITSVNLPVELINRMDDESYNRSALLTNLLDEFFGGAGQAEDAIRRMRIKQIESEMRKNEAENELLSEELSNIKEAIGADDEAYFAELDDILDAMEERMKVDADLPRIKRIALDRHGSSDRGDDVIDDLRERAAEQGRDIDDDHWR